MADYCAVDDAKAMLGGQFGSDQPLGPGSPNSRDGVLATLVTRCSRMFDRETGKPSNFYSPVTGVTRRYSGSGSQYQDVDEFDLITGVVMTSNQQRSDGQVLTVTDPTSPNYVEVLPIQGPPFSQLFLMRGWIPDVYNVGNVAVTGDIITPVEVTHAVAEWVAYLWQARSAGWADMAQRPDGPGLLYVKGIPPDTKRIIEYYKETNRGPKVGVVTGSDKDVVFRWADWLTNPP